jgi:hypothetical protein
LGVRAIQCESDVVEVIGQGGEAVAEVLDGGGDGGFFGEIDGKVVGPGAVFEEGEKTNRDFHENVKRKT